MNNMTVGSIRTTVTPPLTSGIYEALLEKAERERDEARQAFAVATSNCVEAQQRGREMENQRDFAMGEMERLKRERDEALNVLREINDWINVAAMRPKSEITMNESADAINAWGDKIRPILEVTE